jgi:transcriptional regulator with XRE-family HTH domain
MSASFAPLDQRDPTELCRLERLAFAAKLRMARAALGCNQSELACAVGMTQRSVHKLEQGDTEPRRATVFAIEKFWRERGIEFEDLDDGGFRIVIHSALLDGATRPQPADRSRLNIAAVGDRSPAYRA